ncbi:glutamate receptor ionotropic, kainate 5-like [Scylla paramamosain]|uniref:glutamate receptor ionotropic, kainate 5-like n=1 Tax=Scylla paramamosain TaxID=85552 RepID=UPI003082E3D9
MLLHVQEGEEAVSQVGVLVWQPYSAAGSTPMRVATWTPHGRLTLASHVSLFPNKFSVFSSAPSLTVAVELLPHTTLVWVDDPDAPGGRRLEYSGYINNIVRYLAEAMNFTPRYVLSPERTFGTRLPDGSWTGMIGMVVREEADFATGPFIMTLVRKQAADPSTTFYHGNVRIVGGLAGLRVDPWSFMLPLTPLVWTATLTALLGVLAALQVFSSCMSNKTHKVPCYDSWSANTFSPVRVFLQQGEASGTVLGHPLRGAAFAFPCSQGAAVVP